jgi:hypothetical protein
MDTLIIGSDDYLFRKPTIIRIQWGGRSLKCLITTIRAGESVSEQAMAFFMSNGYTVIWGMDLK